MFRVKGWRMMYSSPKISVILPSFNGERWLSASIQSVLMQSEVDWELIVVDDCSSDGTYEIARDFCDKDSRVRVIRNSSNKKLPRSLNVGFSQAKGRYLTWTSDDNLFKPDALKQMGNYLDGNPEVDMVAFNMDVINDEGEFLYEWTSFWPQRSVIDLSYGSNVGAAFMYSRRVLSKIGEYNEEMFCAEDYEYWVRLALNGTVRYVDEINIYQYRVHSQTLTNQKRDIIFSKTAEIQEKYFGKFIAAFNLNVFESSKIIHNSHINGWRVDYSVYWIFLIIFEVWEHILLFFAFLVSPEDKSYRRNLRRMASNWIRPKAR